LWWALHRPETFALSAFAVGMTTFIGLGPFYEVVQSFLLGDQDYSLSTQLGVAAAVRAGVAVLAIGLAVLSIRAEDDDATWSPSLARAALVVSALAAAFAITTVVGVLVTDTPHVPGFTAPSP
jgi:hypothetical protein